MIAPFQEGHAKYARFLAHHQIIVHSLALERASISPFSDIKYFFSLVKIFSKQKYDAAIFYTKKPIIFGNLAASFWKNQKRISIISGLGYGFSVSKSTFSIFIIQMFFCSA